MASQKQNDLIIIDSARLPTLLDGQFFQVTGAIKDSDGGTRIRAMCTKCSRTLRGTLMSTSNFWDHLRMAHSSLVPKYKEYVMSKGGSRKRKWDDSANESEHTAAGPPGETDQEKADALILAYIFATGSSLRKVEEPEFRALVSGLLKLKEPVSYITRETLTEHASSEYGEMIEVIKEELQHTRYVCTTADIWSACQWSFLGVTAHFLNERLERKSRVIACMRFKSPHTHDRIVNALQSIHKSFNLSSEKLTCVVTDNISNFVKTINEFPSPDEEDNEPEDEKFVKVEREASFAAVKDILYKCDDTDGGMLCQEMLWEKLVGLKHHRCCSHIFNLIGSCDMAKLVKENPTTYVEMHQSAMSKCLALWAKINRSSGKGAKSYTSIVGRCPKTPCTTQWKSQFDAIKELLTVAHKLDDICRALNILLFTTEELEFLREFQRCLQPIAYVLDSLQADTAYFGHVYPFVLGVYHNLEVLEQPKKNSPAMPLRYCGPLRLHLMQALQSRFSNLFDFNEKATDYMVATVCHPKWKLWWLPASFADKKDLVKNRTLQAIKELAKENEQSRRFSPLSPTTERAETPTTTDIDYFFSFMKEAKEDLGQSSAELEFLQYLADSSTEIESLQRFESVHEAFRLYNTPIPSSAPVERLFSLAGRNLFPQRSSRNNADFEKCILLTTNQWLA